MRYFVTLSGREIPIDVTRTASGGWHVESDGRAFEVDAVVTGATLSVRVDGRVFDLLLEPATQPIGFQLGRAPHHAAPGERSRGSALIESARSRALVKPAAREAGHGGAVVAPMPGRIVRVLVEAGQEVEGGAPLIVVEAMKMENELRSPRAARVLEVLVKPGDTVARGAPLLVLA